MGKKSLFKGGKRLDLIQAPPTPPNTPLLSPKAGQYVTKAPPTPPDTPPPSPEDNPWPGYPTEHRPVNPNRLFPGLHDTWDLAASAVSSFRNHASENVGVQHARRAWREWSRSELPNLNTKDASALLEPMTIFNNLFFHQQLSTTVMSVEWRDLGSKRGETITNRDTYTSTVLLNPNTERHISNPTGILCTLLHEMCHAYLSRYSCYCVKSEYCKTPERQQRHKENYGTTGHGRAWQFLIKAIEDAAPTLLPGLTVQLGRLETTMLEIEHGGFWPTNSDFELLKPRFELLARVVMKWMVKDDDRIMDRRLEAWVGKWGGQPRRTSRRWSISAGPRRGRMHVEEPESKPWWPAD